MNFPAELFPGQWYAVALLPWLACLGWAVWRAPWKRLGRPEQLHVWAAMIVTLMLLWSMKAGVKPGLSLHLVGATVMTLSFGPYLAIAGLSVVLAAATLNGAAGWSAFPLNAMVMIAVPVLVSHGILRFSERFLPPHLFVYLFVNAFIGAAMMIMVTGLTASVVMFLAGVYTWDYLFTQYLPYMLLLGFSEGWLSGMAMTLMVVYKPEWVSTFDDRTYLMNK
ncbi:MAG: energy-coupling factor ABC transporter permease [Rhodocyclaceae bacterium]|nr:energy-coupling factor ABC transporter permease [Rhodocyclaceae bacterium]